MNKGGMETAWRMECTEECRMVPTAAPTTRAMEVMTKGITCPDRAKREGTEGMMGEG